MSAILDSITVGRRVLACRQLVALLALLVAFGAVHPALAQGEGGATADSAAAPSAALDPGLASPADTLETFVNAMAADPPAYERALDCMETGDLARDGLRDSATRLYRILNRVEWIDFLHDESIPTRYVVSGWSGERVAWRFFPRVLPDMLGISDAVRDGNRTRRDLVRSMAPTARIELTKGADGNWRFSADTVGSIDGFWAVVESLDPLGDVPPEQRTFSERLQALFPAAMQTSTVLGVRVWQWAGLAMLVFAGMMLDLLLRSLLAGISRRVVRRRGGEVQRQTIRRTVRPFGMAAAALLWLFGLRFLGLPNEALLVLGPAIRFFVMLAVVWALFRLSDLVGEYFASRASETATRFDDLVVPLLRKSVKIVIGVFGLIYIAGSFDVEIGPLLTGLGIGGVGFAFAAKDTLENFFGSVTVIVDRPFQVGDWVVIGDTEGTVEELGLRSVRVRTFYNSLVTIPTANLVRAAVDNYGERKYRRWTTHLTIAYETPPTAIEAFCEGIRELIRAHPYTRKDYYQVWLHKFGAHSLDVLVYMFFEAPEWSTELRERHRLMLDIMRLADRLGVVFAYPTQRLLMERGETPVEIELPEPSDVTATPRGTNVMARRRGQQIARAMTEDARWRNRKPSPYRFVGAGEDPDAEPDDETAETQIESKVGGDAG